MAGSLGYELDVTKMNEEEKEEVKKYLEWRANDGKMNTETLPDRYVEACKKILGGIENE